MPHRTPTQLIYHAWTKTSHPVLYETRDANGEVKIAECDFADPVNMQEYNSSLSGACAICGAEFTGGALVKNVLSASYTDWDRHKRPDATYLCAACMFCIGMNVKAGRVTLFRYSFFASDKGLEICNRKQIRDMLIEPPRPPFVAVCTTSQKKHLSTKSAVSYSRDRYICMLEEEQISVNRQDIERAILVIEALKCLGATSNEIRTGDYKYERMREWGHENLDTAKDIVNDVSRDARMFELALFAARKHDNEEAARCYLGFKPKT